MLNINNKFKNIFSLALVIFINASLQSFRLSSDYSKGPLLGKNMFIPYLIYYSPMGQRASYGKRFTLEYHSAVYFINDFFATNYSVDTNGNYFITEGLDYESLNIEIGLSFYILKNLQVGIDTRIYTYYGGFLDNIIQGFHYAFGFPNAGRDWFIQNNTFIKIPNKNGVPYFLNKQSASLGDLDLWIKYGLFQNKFISVAIEGAFKIPTGQMPLLSGSGYPDLSFGILLDLRPLWFLSFYTQVAFVLPIDSIVPIVPSHPYPMVHSIFAVELNPLKFFSILMQFNIKSSPIEGYFWYSTINHEFFSAPQTNLLVGVIFKYKQFKWQAYFEEDTFTNDGADITINFLFSQSINLRRL